MSPNSVLASARENAVMLYVIVCLHVAEARSARMIPAVATTADAGSSGC
jgi:hypothetical protein